MSNRMKLQKAIETVITAGYQLNSEAFDFLNMIATTDDPVVIVRKALQRLDKLEEKSFFIDRLLLEALVKPTEQSIEAPLQSLGEVREEQPEERLTEGKRKFRPYAKEIEAKIKVIEDPTGKLSSNGTIEDSLQYFQDRFERLERLLRQRIDVRAATPILEAVKAPFKSKLKIKFVSQSG